MGDVRDILRGGAISDLMSQSHPAPDSSSRQPHSPTSGDPWRWTEYKSKYRPFSQYSYSGGSWHRNQPLDTTDGPSSWYAEVAERIHKAEEYKTRSRSSGIGETDYPSERNRLIWSNSVSALTLHDTVDSAAGHRRQKSRFHSLGPAFPLAKDNKPPSATSTGGGAGGRSAAGKARTSRSVSRRRIADGGGKTPAHAGVSPTKDGGGGPGGGGGGMTGQSARTSFKTPPKREGGQEAKETTKDSKPRAVVKPTPAKDDKAKHDDKKWIKPAPASINDTIEKDKGGIQTGPGHPKATKETKPTAVTPPAPTATGTAASATGPATAAQTAQPKDSIKPAADSQAVKAASDTVKSTQAAAAISANQENLTTKKDEPKPTSPAKAEADPAKVAGNSTKRPEPVNTVAEPTKGESVAAAPAKTDQAAAKDAPAVEAGGQLSKQETRAADAAKEPAAVTLATHASAAPTSASSSAHAAPASAGDLSPAAPAPVVAPAVQKSAPVDPMAQSFIDHSTIGAGGGGVRTAPKPGDFSLARSRLDEFWAEGK